MSGGRPRRVSDRQILKVFDDSSDPVLTTKEVTTHVDLTSQGVYKRLESLVEDGRLTSKIVGANAKIYWLTQYGKDSLAERDET